MAKRDLRAELTAISTRPPKGTRDFYPEDMRLRAWLFDHFREIARRFGFEEIDAPVVEHAELFQRKAGEEIVDQLYHFDLHGRHLALRGEITPQVARMVMARQGALRLPLRWFSIPQCWRYERMTRGRRREHFQWNMDIWGVPGPEAEAELIAAVLALLDRLSLPRSDAMVRLSSRKLLEELLRRLAPSATEAAFETVCVIIDKLDKIGPDAVIAQLTDPDGPAAAARLERAQAERLVGFLELRALDDAEAAFGGASPALAELRELHGLLDAYGVADRVRFDASVVRGLAYYTGIVFEAFDTGGALRALCGGGRYDRLVESLGGRPVPAVGFGFGDAVIVELLAEKGLLPALERALDAVVVAIGEPDAAASAPQHAAAIALATRLRGDGQAVELVHEPRLKRALGRADRAGAARVYLIGPDEVRAGHATVRDLRSGEQTQEPLAAAARDTAKRGSP